MKEVNDVQPSTSTGSYSLKNESRKRCASCSDEPNVSAKRVATQDDTEDAFELLDFTDEILLEIVKNCDSPTLYSLSK